MTKPYLLCVKGEHKGVKFTLPEGISTIGRAEENTIVISDNLVSRHHATIHCEENRVSVRDRGSVNSTFINGIEVKDSILIKNDAIDIGPVRFLYNADIDLKFGAGDGHPIYFSPSTDETHYRPKSEELPPSRWDHESQKVLGFLKLFSMITATSGDAGDFDPEGLANLVAHINELFNADCAILLLWEEGLQSLQPIYSTSDEREIWTSNKLIQKVFREARPDGLDCVLTHGDTREDDTKGGVLDRSCIAAPLIKGEKSIGVIYVHKKKRNFYTYEDYLQLGLLAQLMRIAVDYYRVMERFQNLELEMKEDKFLVKSDEMIGVFRLGAKAAQVDTTVLITGETGVGKEILSQYIHNQSLRRARPFVVLNCASIPAELFESELFGHEKGAFTGAHKQHKGKIEVAHRGTLFLDEIGELNFAMQSKILRFLQDKVIYRVGGTSPIFADVRIIAATNRNLSKMVVEGTFREDLIYRLNVMQINIPPLRNRRSEIIPLARFFLDKYETDFNKHHMIGFSEDAILALEQHDWPGNVRELENAIERAVLLSENPVIEPHDLMFHGTRFTEKAGTTNKTQSTIQITKEETQKPDTGEKPIIPLKDWERDHIERVLEICNWNQMTAAKALGIHRNTLRNKINEYNLEKENT